jgi:hypothetical protein
MGGVIRSLDYLVSIGEWYVTYLVFEGAYHRLFGLHWGKSG